MFLKHFFYSDLIASLCASTEKRFARWLIVLHQKHKARLNADGQHLSDDEIKTFVALLKQWHLCDAYVICQCVLPFRGKIPLRAALKFLGLQHSTEVIRCMSMLLDPTMSKLSQKLLKVQHNEFARYWQTPIGYELPMKLEW